MKTSNLALFLLCVVANTLVARPASTEIYRYVKDDGTVLFTTEPLPGVAPDEVLGEAEPEERAAAQPAVAGPPPTTNPNPGRDPNAFDDIIREASATYGLPFALIKAVIRVESGFDPHSTSHAGAQGLMQLMPATARSLNCSDPFDPRQNILAGTQYLSILANRYNGDLNLMLSAYNAGSGAVSRFDGIPYEATRRYVERVYQYNNEYLDAANR